MCRFPVESDLILLLDLAFTFQPLYCSCQKKHGAGSNFSNSGDFRMLLDNVFPYLPWNVCKIEESGYASSCPWFRGFVDLNSTCSFMCLILIESDLSLLFDFAFYLL